MKLLFITQKVDKNDDLLGIYHEWIKKSASDFESVNVICLYKGGSDFPLNVRVYSLGKLAQGWSARGGGKLSGKIKALIKFYKYVWLLRKEYDVVFVHMNPEYLILAGLLWRLLNKKVVLWYAHFQDNLKLRVAVFFTNKVVTSVKEAFPFNTNKLIILQQGIDIHRFIPKEINNHEKDKINILFVGRISPVKNLDTLVKAFGVLVRKYNNLHLNIVGGSLGKDEYYLRRIKDDIKTLGLSDTVSFLGKISNNQTPDIYRSNDIFVNLTKSGSFDKTTLEAMSSGLVTVVSNSAFENIFNDEQKEALMFRERDASELATKIENLINLPKENLLVIKKEMRDIIVKKHSLDNLIDKLAYVFKE